MKVTALQPNPAIYTCRTYLVRGDWNTLDDVNALIDPGADGHVIDEIRTISTGVGKRPVERVVLTHGHFDHASGVTAVQKAFAPEVLAQHPAPGWLPLREGQDLLLGDRYFRVHQLPVHSADSILLYCAAEGVLFSGDTPLRVQGSDGSYPPEFARFIEYLLGSGVKAVYPGHGPPVFREEAAAMLRETLRRLNESPKAQGGQHV